MTLKEYSVEEIKTYIDRYAKVVNDRSYYFDTKWTLAEFLKQKNAISGFADDGSKWVNYCNRQGQNLHNNDNYVAKSFSTEELKYAEVDLDKVSLT